jgi:hypothetical protein
VANPAVQVLVPITLTPTNDPPTVTAGAGSVAIGVGGVAIPVTGFTVDDVDYSDGGSPDSTTGELDFVQVIVRIADNSGVPLAASAYAGTTTTDIVIASGTAPAEGAGFEIDDTSTGSGSALVVRGTRANVNAYLGGLTVAFSGALANPDSSYRVEVIADDRLRDVGTGVLDVGLSANGGKNPDGADGGTAPDDVPATAIDPYAATPGGLAANVGANFRGAFVSGINDPAQVTATDVTVNEGSATLDLTAAVGAFGIADPDDNGAATLSATVTLGNGVFSAVGGAGGVAGRHRHQHAHHHRCDRGAAQFAPAGVDRHVPGRGRQPDGGRLERQLHGHGRRQRRRQHRRAAGRVDRRHERCSRESGRFRFCRWRQRQPRHHPHHHGQRGRGQRCAGAR